MKENHSRNDNTLLKTKQGDMLLFGHGNGGLEWLSILSLSSRGFIEAKSVQQGRSRNEGTTAHLAATGGLLFGRSHDIECSDP